MSRNLAYLGQCFISCVYRGAQHLVKALKVLVELFLSGSTDIWSRLQSAHVCLSGEVPVVYVNFVLVGFSSVSALCWVQENLWICRLSNFFFFFGVRV